ncbi:MAG: hypothetical protein HJHJAOHD_01809 [Flavobacteriales bacterium]|nr:hypothetical protein [Flavobacteriales bacterium]MCL4815463.1 hypothetical protein [Flavobacteriales bacterium]WKZ75082.1 MAG: hypothetical protein QY303_13135 [Vicingaceae bacterium]
MKAHKLLYLLLVFVLFATCKKDRNRLFKTKVHGTVLDYFDLKPVEGVKVSVVYTYDFKEYSWPYNYPPPNEYKHPCVEPDTLEQTYTNAKGEFELKFPVRKEVDICGISPNVVNEGTNYGYLLIFEKPGTDYFKQYYSLGFADKNNIQVLYRIRPLVTLEFRIYTLTKQNEYVRMYLFSGSDFYGKLNGKSTPVIAKNIDTTLFHKLSFNREIKFSIGIRDSLMTQYYYSDNQTIFVEQKNYLYEIIY